MASRSVVREARISLEQAKRSLAVDPPFTHANLGFGYARTPAQKYKTWNWACMKGPFVRDLIAL